MSEQDYSWNPDTDGRPNEKYRTYKNKTIGTFSDEAMSKWKYFIDENVSNLWYENEIEARKAIFVELGPSE